MALSFLFPGREVELGDEVVDLEADRVSLGSVAVPSPDAIKSRGVVGRNI